LRKRFVPAAGFASVAGTLNQFAKWFQAAGGRWAEIGLVLLAGVVGGPAGRAAAIMEVGSEKQLFIDERFVEQPVQVALKVHAAQKTDERSLVPDRPWENAALNWFSVLEDQGKYRMWYECYDVEGWPTSDDTSFCYAESQDGIHWVKPDLEQFTYHGSRKNNIVFRQIGTPEVHSRVHGAGVFLDPHAPPEARYKCVSQGNFAAKVPAVLRVAGMVSADGLAWNRLARPICEVFADSQYSCFWDPPRGKYILYGRVNGRGRSIGAAMSADFSRFDPLALVCENDGNSDLYNPAALKYPEAADVYLMFPSLYRHKEDTLEIYLAVSRDGQHWRIPDLKTPFIALGKAGTFDSGSLYAGQGLVKVSDELWHYFSGSRLKHQEVDMPLMIQPGNERIFSRARIRLDGYMSVDAGAAEGSFVTPPIRFSGGELVLNAQVRPEGKLQVGLLNEQGKPLPGLSCAECKVVSGDHVRCKIKWDGNPGLAALAGRPVRLQFRMIQASLFSFQFTHSNS